MCRDVVTHTIGVEVGRRKHHAAHRQVNVTQSVFENHRQQHVEHRARGFTQLVEHEQHRLALTLGDTEASVGCIRCGHAVPVDHWHSQVTKVEVGHVDVAGQVVRHALGQRLEDA